MDSEIDAMQNAQASAHPAEAPTAPVAAQIGAAGEAELSTMDLLADKLMAESIIEGGLETGSKNQSKTYKHPMIIDLLLAAGLLICYGRPDRQLRQDLRYPFCQDKHFAGQL